MKISYILLNCIYIALLTIQIFRKHFYRNLDITFELKFIHNEKIRDNGGKEKLCYAPSLPGHHMLLNP